MLWPVRFFYFAFAVLVVLGPCQYGPKYEVLAEEPGKNTQVETVPPLSHEEAVKSIRLPAGFRATLFAGHPQVRQPIGIASDARGRIWVAENDTYAEQKLNFDLDQSDRIIILEDTDRDGKADKRTVFLDGLKRLTSVELGYGGVWALCAPQMLFIPDRNGDDVPDGPAEVVLDGFDAGPVRHNVVNGLRWGPDGWLYGRHGIQATSYVGIPGAPASARTPLNCSIWRYQPTNRRFEVITSGTTNSWGHDWDAHGELFFINTVIGHLWHAMPGMHFERMYGEDLRPHLYRLIPQTADHVHWHEGEPWSAIRTQPSKATDDAGGGHAHSGLMIYQGEEWPAPYRDLMLTVNYHGRRLNCDRIERHGATYIGKHMPDLMRVGDPYFRGVDLYQGYDGVYLTDWSDIGECHENDGVHRSSGRIYRIHYGTEPLPPKIDLQRKTGAELLLAQLSGNEWLVRQARRVMKERKVLGEDFSGLRFHWDVSRTKIGDQPRYLRMLWAGWAAGLVDEAILLKELESRSEHVRIWAIRLLMDNGTPSETSLAAIERHALNDPSDLVRTTCASALNQLPVSRRFELGRRLLQFDKLASDRVYPLLVWYGVEPLVAESAPVAISLLNDCKIPEVTGFIARRLASNHHQNRAGLDRLTEWLTRQATPLKAQQVLAGINEGLRGWSKVEAPAGWDGVVKKWNDPGLHDVSLLVNELSATFGSGRAVEDLIATASDEKQNTEVRRRAIVSLGELKTPKSAPLLVGLAKHRDLGTAAIRALSGIDNEAELSKLVALIPNLRGQARSTAIEVVASRPATARKLLALVEKETLPKDQLQTFQLRQIRLMEHPELNSIVARLWPDLSDVAGPKGEKIEQLRSELTDQVLLGANLARGEQLFGQHCAKCHKLLGHGGQIGPDLTGAQRNNLTYLLENVIDPSATLAKGFRMSILELKDGRVLNGVVTETGEQTLSVQTPTEKLMIRVDQVEERRESGLSLMPEGLIDLLSAEDRASLFGYLRVAGLPK